MWTGSNTIGSAPMSFPTTGGAVAEIGLFLGGQYYGSNLGYPTGLIGWNVFRDSPNWDLPSDTLNNGGAAIFAGQRGYLYFATVPSSPSLNSGVATQVLTDADLMGAAQNWINPNGTVNGFSDARLKRDVVTLTGALEQVLRLRAVRYRWTSEGPDDPLLLGLIAQEVEKVFPEVVGERPDGMKGLDYSRLVVPLIAAIQELAAQRDAEAARYEALNARLTALERRAGQ
jgi:hypothetical protein